MKTFEITDRNYVTYEVKAETIQTDGDTLVLRDDSGALIACFNYWSSVIEKVEND
jgi:DNA/RNA-binding domain of Phe-tRNA-synthetase-like protein